MLLNRPTLLRLPGEGGACSSPEAAAALSPTPAPAVSSSPARRREHRGPTCFSGWPGAPSWRAASAQGRRAEAQGQPSRLRPRRRRASTRFRPPGPRRPRALAPPAGRLAPVPSSARSRWHREGRPGCRTASCRPRSPWRPAGQHSQAGGGAEGARPGPRAAAAQAEETARGGGRG